MPDDPSADPRLPRHRSLTMAEPGTHPPERGRSRSRARRPASRSAPPRTPPPRTSIARSPRRARPFSPWRDAPAQERARAIRKASAILREHADELAWLEAVDTGNPFQAMRYDVEISADYMDYFAGLVTEIKGDTIPIGAGTLNYTLREPLGVVARIGAFNHPLLFAAGKCGAPLAAGNTLIVKPADQTPLSSLRIAELWDGVFPPGVFNVVTGGREAGAALVAHPKVAKIGFIGSVAAGRAVMSAAGRDAQGADARARRQERADRLRRRGARRGRRRRRARDELPLRHRPVVQLDEPRLPARRHPRRGAGGDRQARRSAQGRPADRAATPKSGACRARRSSTRR